jgi:hypothetical protein
VNDNPLIGLQPAGTGAIPSFTAVNNSSPKKAVVANITVTPVYTGGGVECLGTPVTFRITVLPTISIDLIPSVETCTGTAIAALTPKPDTAFYSGATVSYVWTVTGSGITLQGSSGAQIPGYGTENNGTSDLVATITVTPRYTLNNRTCNGQPVFVHGYRKAFYPTCRSRRRCGALCSTFVYHAGKFCGRHLRHLETDQRTGGRDCNPNLAYLGYQRAAGGYALSFCMDANRLRWLSTYH